MTTICFLLIYRILFQLVIRVAADFENREFISQSPLPINSLTLIVCLYYVNFVAKLNKLELEVGAEQ